MKRIFFSTVVITLLASCQSNNLTSSNNVIVTASGTGISKQEALNNSLVNAVRTAAGELTISERKVVNDNLYEKIISYSDGVVKTYSELSTRRDSRGIYLVEISATVDKNRLTKYLNQSVSNNPLLGANISAYGLTARERALRKEKLIIEYRNQLIQNGFEISVGNSTTRVTKDYFFIELPLAIKIKKDYVNNFRNVFEQAGIVKEKPGLGITLLRSLIDPNYANRNAQIIGDAYEIIDPDDRQLFFSYGLNNGIPLKISINGSSGINLALICTYAPPASNLITFPQPYIVFDTRNSIRVVLPFQVDDQTRNRYQGYYSIPNIDVIKNARNILVTVDENCDRGKSLRQN